jgi:hypothetical protein
MVLTEVEKVMVALIGRLEVMADDVLGAMKTLLHKLLYRYGLRGGVHVHSEQYICVSGVCDLQRRPQQVRVVALDDLIFGGAHRVPSSDCQGKNARYSLIRCT